MTLTEISQSASPTSASLPSPFVGREAELALFADAITTAAMGMGRVILIGGEAGIGKTRLAQEAASNAAHRGVKIHWGRCWEGRLAPAFWPWAQILRGYAAEIAASQSSSQSELATIAAAIPELRDILPLRHDIAMPHDTATRTAAEARFELFDALTRLLSDLARSGPAMLILDDVHFADEGSFQLLRLLGTVAGSIPIILVAIYRDTATPLPQPQRAGLASLTKEYWTQRLFLKGLEHTAVASYLRSVTGEDAPAPITNAITLRTNGNPFFVKELVDCMRRLGDFTPSALGTISTVLPQSIREAILQRLISIPTSSRELLQVASVIGVEFDLALLAHTSRVPARDVVDHLDAAIDSGLVETSSSTYRFTHLLVRDTLYSLIPRSRKSRLHSAIADAIDLITPRVSGPATVLLAYHRSAAYVGDCDVSKLVFSLLSAGHYCRQQLAYEEAASYFRRALDLGGALLDAVPRCETLLTLGEAESLAGHSSDARKTLASAADEARRLDDAELFGRIALAYRGLLAAAIPPDEPAISLLLEAMARAGPGASPLRVQLASAIAEATHFRSDLRDRQRYAEAAYSDAIILNEPQLVAASQACQLTCLLNPTPQNQRVLLRTATDLLDLATESADADMRFRAHLALRACHLASGDYPASREALRQIRTISHETRHPRHTWYSLLLEVGDLLAHARFEDAALVAVQAQQFGAQFHYDSSAQFSMMQGFELARARGDFGEWADAHRRTIDSPTEHYIHQAGSALAHASLGNLDRALELIEPLAQSHFREVTPNLAQLWVLGMLAEVCSDSGPNKWREELYSTLMPFKGHGIVVSWGFLFDGSVDYYLGLLAAAIGQPKEAQGYFDSALQFAHAMRSPLMVARTRARQAKALLVWGTHVERPQALQLLEAAARSLESLGLGRQAEAVRSLEATAVLSGSGASGLSATHPLQTMHPAEFFCEGDYWTVSYGGLTVRLSDSRGLQYIGRLLLHAESDHHVLDLVTETRASPQRDPSEPIRPEVGRSTDADVCDAQARSSYRARLADIAGDLAEAQEFNDLGRIERLTGERNKILLELSRAYGIGGRARKLGGAPSERARVSVRNNISNTLKLIRQHHLGLWRHLRASLRTGTFCSYRPETPTDWRIRMAPGIPHSGQSPGSTAAEC